MAKDEVTEEEIEAYKNAVEEIEEEVKEDQLEEDLELQKEIDELDSSVMPDKEEQHNVINFLNDVLKSPDRFKTGYLTWEELGKPTFSTRYWMNLANACDKLYGFEMIKEYCLMKARITSDTSLSREGFIISTAVTSKKVKEKKTGDLPQFLSTKK